MRKVNISGLKFGKLTATDSFIVKSGKTKFLCECECGNKKYIYSCHLISLKTLTCGSCGDKRHNLTNSPEFQSWHGMKERCLNKNHEAFYRYGGRGITICNSWMLFKNFYNDMGKRPKGKTLDRIDNDLGYFKENCKWSTKEEQANNTSRNRIYKCEDKYFTGAQLSNYLNISTFVVWYMTKNNKFRYGIELIK